MIAERLSAQLLAGPPARDPVAVAERLLAIQAQDPRGARLAVRVRSTGLSAGAVDNALTQDRSLVISWLARGTLHLARSEDYPWLHALTTPPLLAGNTRQLAQDGVSGVLADRAVAVIEHALADEGPLTREQLRDRLAAAGTPTGGQVMGHLLLRASLRGTIVRGPMAGPRHAYVLVCDWLGKAPRVDRERALAELARRYLAGHGPADARDLARWAGLPLRDCRAGLAAIAPELRQRPDGLVDLARRVPAAGLGAPRLLGAFDPVLLGWRSRAGLLAEHEPVIVAKANGMFRPFALVRGRAVGTWALRAGRVTICPLVALAARDAAALEADARDVERYLGAAGYSAR
jgi:hypothetical protein